MHQSLLAPQFNIIFVHHLILLNKWKGRKHFLDVWFTSKWDAQAWIISVEVSISKALCGGYVKNYGRTLVRKQYLVSAV